MKCFNLYLGCVFGKKIRNEKKREAPWEREVHTRYPHTLPEIPVVSPYTT